MRNEAGKVTRGQGLLSSQDQVMSEEKVRLGQQKTRSFFCKGPDSNYLGFMGLRHNFSTPLDSAVMA